MGGINSMAAVFFRYDTPGYAMPANAQVDFEGIQSGIAWADAITVPGVGLSAGNARRYAFLGWELDGAYYSDGSVAGTQAFPATVDETMTFTAKFAENVAYTVNFAVPPGQEGYGTIDPGARLSFTLYQGESLDKALEGWLDFEAKPKTTGVVGKMYRFVRWEAQASGEIWTDAANTAFGGYVPAGDETIYAYFEELDPYTVTYHNRLAHQGLSGAVPTDNNTYENGEFAAVLGNTGNLAAPGLEMIGWEDGEGNKYLFGSGGVPVPGSIEISGIVDLYAIWDTGFASNDFELKGFTQTYDGEAYSLELMDKNNKLMEGDELSFAGDTGTYTATVPADGPIVYKKYVNVAESDGVAVSATITRSGVVFSDINTATAVITPREITVTWGGVCKPYNGALQSSGYVDGAVTSGELAPGEDITVVAAVAQAQYTSSPVRLATAAIDLSSIDADSNVVYLRTYNKATNRLTTGNYKVEAVYENFEIDPVTITVKADSILAGENVVYDATEHTKDAFSVSHDGVTVDGGSTAVDLDISAILPGHKVSATITGGITNVFDSPVANALSGVQVSNATYADLEAEGSVRVFVENGSLELLPREVTVRANSSYGNVADGKTVYNVDGYTVEESTATTGLLTGHRIENLHAGASNAAVGSWPVTFWQTGGGLSVKNTHNLALGNLADNYDISYIGGVLEVLGDGKPTPPGGSDYTHSTLTDPATGITLIGWFTPGTTLNVTKNYLHEKGTCDACDKIRAAGTPASLYDVSIVGSHDGNVELALPVPEGYNGQQMLVWHCKSNHVDEMQLTASGGFVKGAFSSLSPFAVFATSNTTATVPQTGDNSNIDLWIALLCASVTTLAGYGVVLWRRKKRLKQK